MGPIVEIELVEPYSVVPQDVTFHIQHFLSVPHCPEANNELMTDGDAHDIVKVTKVGDTLTIESIDSHAQLDSEYLSTERLQGQTLCHITTAWLWGEGKKECIHSSLKRIVVTSEKEMCPHQQGTLAVWCYCDAAEERFEKLLEKQNQKHTGFFMVQNIEKGEKERYQVLASPSHENGPCTQREISHLEMCKYVGVRQLGESVQEEFDCKCAEGSENPESHCRSPKQIFINVKEESTGNWINPYSKNLRCDSGRAGETDTAG